MTLTIIAILILIALLGAPLFAVITGAAMFGFFQSEIDLSVMAIELYRIADTPILLALPLFTFAGYLLGESNTSQRLVRLTQAFLGWMPGGLAMVSFVVCALFTAFTGASGVTIVALGALLYPALKQAGYGENFSLGLVTTSGSLGLLLPPLFPLILYGIIAQQMSEGADISIEDLFLAGIFPALLMILMLSAWSIWANRNSPVPLTRFSMENCRAAIKESLWEIPLPFFVFTGIYSGYFAVSEAAAVTAMYVLVVEIFIYKEIALSRLPGIIRESMIMVGGILIILGVSLAFTNFLIDAEAPMKLFEICQSFVSSKLVFLILLNIFLLLLGAMLDIFSAIIIMVPLMLPVALEYGVNPVHLGIIFLANMQIGYFTPPVGMNLFIAGYRFEKPIVEIYRATIPFMLVLLLSVLIITYWPNLSLFLLSQQDKFDFPSCLAGGIIVCYGTLMGKMKNSLANKKILVVGGSSGIGLAVSKQVCKAGGKLMIASRNASEKHAALSAAVDHDIETCSFDVTAEKATEAALEKIGRVDHLVIATRPEIPHAPFTRTDLTQARAAFETKFWGPYQLIQKAQGQIHQNGSIVMTTGIAGEKIFKHSSSMAAINGAIEAFCRSLAVELAPIRVNAVSPDFVEPKSPEVKKYARQFPSGRIASSQEIADAYIFLMENPYITGTSLVIDGGARLI